MGFSAYFYIILQMEYYWTKLNIIHTSVSRKKTSDWPIQILITNQIRFRYRYLVKNSLGINLKNDISYSYLQLFHTKKLNSVLDLVGILQHDCF